LAGYPAIDGPGNERIQRILGDHTRKIYGVFDVSRLDHSTIKTFYRDQLALWALAFTEDPCHIVTLKPPSAEWSWLNNLIRVKTRYGAPVFLLCALEHSGQLQHEVALAGYRDFVRTLGPLAQRCPEYFGKPLGFVRTDKAWFVRSFATAEARFSVFDVGPVLLQKVTPPHVTVTVGRVTDGHITLDNRKCDEWFMDVSARSKIAARSGYTDPVVQ